MQRLSRRRPSRGGFTLLEILIVLGIIAVIAAMVVPRLLGQAQAANVRATKASIRSLESTINIFAVSNNGQLPQDLSALMSPFVSADGIQNDALLDRIPNDAWQQPFNYEIGTGTTSGSSSRPRIWSNGPNGQNDNGSADDINNWADLVQ